MTEPTPFKLESRDAVVRFETLINAYLKARSQFSVHHMSLVRAFDEFQQHPDGGRLFSALLDIYINFALLQTEILGISATWNHNFGGNKPKPADVLSSPPAFFATVDIHRFNTAFVFRYRALWDKIMGFIVMIYAPADYDTFRQAKSRRRAFRKIMEPIHAVPNEAIQSIEQVINDFDRKFRTPEAHGTGSLRKWSFLAVGADKNPAGELIGFWNIMNRTMAGLGAPWKEPEQPSGSPGVISSRLLRVAPPVARRRPHSPGRA